MIAILIILIILFFLYDKSYKVNRSLDNIDLCQAKKLMIVAHPDDETLWGGGHLSEGNYLVVCLTAGSSRLRVHEFKRAMKKSGNQCLLLGYPDLKITGVANWQKEWKFIIADVKEVLQAKKWSLVVTHNEQGEYGHRHHRYTSQIVTELMINQKIASPLYYFGKYYKKGLEKGHKITKEQLNVKQKMLKSYLSQLSVRIMFHHMYPYENWKLKKD